jgi:hypothetical protein
LTGDPLPSGLLSDGQACRPRQTHAPARLIYHFRYGIKT